MEFQLILVAEIPLFKTINNIFIKNIKKYLKFVFEYDIINIVKEDRKEMNERNSGRGIFYGVIGVATLVVAIIGATFAYFTASAQTTYTDQIAGGTNDALASISLTVERVYPAKATYANIGTGVNGLVPANIGTTGGTLATEISNAVNSGCVYTASGTTYIGCHVYKISARADADVSNATVTVDDFDVTATDTDDWNFAIFELSGTTASNATATSLSTGTISSAVQVYNGALGTTPVDRYLIVYITNQDAAQNQSGTDQTDQTGTYTGSVTFEVAGGNEVHATFSA